LISACNDPIFYAISLEVEPKDPIIKGSPTNFARLHTAVYVASGNWLWKYTGKWQAYKKFDDKILQITSTRYYLYALCYNENSSNVKTIKQMDISGKWTDISVDTGAYKNIQNIYSANDKLFILASNTASPEAISHAVYHYSNSGQGWLAHGELSGAAYNGTNYFICTRQGSIYRIDGASLNPELLFENPKVSFMGIINLENSENSIVSITRKGELYAVDNTTATAITDISFGGRLATGALTVFKEYLTDQKQYVPKLLLAGRQDILGYTTDSGYIYGYLELDLDDSGVKSNFIEPGINSYSSIYGDNERFISTVGKYPVNSIFQTPYEIDEKMTLFASTQKNGVWSYREIDGEWQWNAVTE